MNLPTTELIQRAFRIKYGYPTELSADQIYQEFERRYNLALDIRRTPGSELSWTKPLEGISLLKCSISILPVRHRINRAAIVNNGWT